MRIPLFFLVFLAPLLGAWSQVPWKLQTGLALSFADGSRSSQPAAFVEVAGFAQALTPVAPEFFDLGFRSSWETRGWTASLGVRHKLYFSSWRSTNQEVMVGHRWGPGTDAWILSGRFGAGLPWSGSDSAYATVSTDLALTWSVGWQPETGKVDSGWGLALGLGTGSGHR